MWLLLLLPALLFQICTASPEPPPPPPPRSIVVVTPTAPVPINGIAEWTLTIKDSSGSGNRSAWEALNITLDLVPPPGAAPYNASHRGFLYAGSVWKVRAALRSPGQHDYTLTAAWTGSSAVLHRSQGTAACSATAPAQNTSVGPRGYLRPRFGLPPFRTAFEDGTLFTGLGIGDCLNDQLTFATYNESDGGEFTRSLEQYVDFCHCGPISDRHSLRPVRCVSPSRSALLIAPIDAVWVRCSCQFNDDIRYVRDYSEAGFNIFRWSNGNCAWRIEKSFDGSLGRPVGNVYNETLVLELDRLFDTFRARGMSMWAVPFAKLSRNPLFPNMGDGDSKYHQAQRQAIEGHLQFVVARWGAQTDVWSLLNEQRADAGWLSVAADFVRSIDPYHHPITSSWNDHINMSQIEMDSVHW